MDTVIEGFLTSLRQKREDKKTQKSLAKYEKLKNYIENIDKMQDIDELYMLFEEYAYELLSPYSIEEKFNEKALAAISREFTKEFEKLEYNRIAFIAHPDPGDADTFSDTNCFFNPDENVVASADLKIGFYSDLVSVSTKDSQLQALYKKYITKALPYFKAACVGTHVNAVEYTRNGEIGIRFVIPMSTVKALYMKHVRPELMKELNASKPNADKIATEGIGTIMTIIYFSPFILIGAAMVAADIHERLSHKKIGGSGSVSFIAIDPDDTTALQKIVDDYNELTRIYEENRGRVNTEKTKNEINVVGKRYRDAIRKFDVICHMSYNSYKTFGKYLSSKSWFKEGTVLPKDRDAAIRDLEKYHTLDEKLKTVRDSLLKAMRNDKYSNSAFVLTGYVNGSE